MSTNSSFEEISPGDTSDELQTANIVDNKVVILFEKSVEIHEFASGNKVILSSVSILIDMSLDKSDTILFVLGEEFVKIVKLSWVKESIAMFLVSES